ncbi:hypothetical protein Ndes2526B_g08534 [Nannochloris sp. 'desiccata']
MSRKKVKEDILGPLAQGGAQFTIQTWHCYLSAGDADPVTIEHELPFNISTCSIEKKLMTVGCWRRDLDNCFRFSSKIKDAVMEILSEALVENPASEDEVSEASSPIQQLDITTPIEPTETLKRRYEDESGTASNIAVDDLGHNVKMIYFVDGRVGLEGTLLKNTAPLLETILHFIPLDSSLGSLSCSQRTSDTPRWVSSWPINLVERSFVHTVIKHRIPALVTNEDQLVAIPEDAEPVPARFRPRTSSGKPLKGPYISWNSSKPYNVGRQYFSTFNTDDSDGFLWADGTTGWSVQSKVRAAQYQEKEESKKKQQGMLQLVGEFDMLDPGEVLLQEEGSGEWDGEMWRDVPKVDFVVEVADGLLPTKRQRCLILNKRQETSYFEINH